MPTLEIFPGGTAGWEELETTTTVTSAWLGDLAVHLKTSMITQAGKQPCSCSDLGHKTVSHRWVKYRMTGMHRNVFTKEIHFIRAKWDCFGIWQHQLWLCVFCGDTSTIWNHMKGTAFLFWSKGPMGIFASGYVPSRKHQLWEASPRPWCVGRTFQHAHGSMSRVLIACWLWDGCATILGRYYLVQKSLLMSQSWQWWGKPFKQQTNRLTQWTPIVCYWNDVVQFTFTNKWPWCWMGMLGWPGGA